MTNAMVSWVTCSYLSGPHPFLLKFTPAAVFVIRPYSISLANEIMLVYEILREIKCLKLWNLCCKIEIDSLLFYPEISNLPTCVTIHILFLIMLTFEYIVQSWLVEMYVLDLFHLLRKPFNRFVIFYRWPHRLLAAREALLLPITARNC
jgi:hypothetical protein